MSWLVSAYQRTLLFLIADTGAGHRSAANAIRNAITVISQKEQEKWHLRQQQSTGENDTSAPATYRIEIIDVFEQYSRFPLREAMKLYGPTIRYNPRLFGQFFHMTNEASKVSAAQTVATPLIHKGLIQLITNVQPDVIVSIHPMLNHVTIQALRELGLAIPFITVVTDLVTVHYAWYAPGADAYIVPTEQARQLYLRRGLDPERVHVLGMPIDPKFTCPMESKAELQRKLELDPGKPVVLLVGGGEGSGGLQACVRAISNARLSVQLLVIAGRNRRLYARLQQSRSSLHVPTKVFGFVQNMPEMMHTSDVIITKAGPGTICEALACDLPIILSGYVPGQEEGNVDYVLENGVGVLVHDIIELVDELRHLLKPGSAVLRQRLEHAKRISRPLASFDIANCILSFLPPANQPSVWQTAWRGKRTASERLLSPVRIRALRRRLPRLTGRSFVKSSVLRSLSRLHPQPLGLSGRLTRPGEINHDRNT